jgi:hypothetical protein
MAQSITAKSISNRIYWAKDRGYKDLQQELKELRNKGIIIFRTPLSASKEVLFDKAGGLVMAFEELGRLDQARRFNIDDDHSIRVILPGEAIVQNWEALKKLNNLKTDVVLNEWLIVKRRDPHSNTIRMIPNGYGNYQTFGNDALRLSCYFDCPVFTRVVKMGPDEIPHAIVATYVDGADVVSYKLRAAERGMRIEIEWK